MYKILLLQNIFARNLYAERISKTLEGKEIFLKVVFER